MGSKLQKNVLTSKSLSNNLLDLFLLQCQCRGARLYVYVLAPLQWHWNGTKDRWVAYFLVDASLEPSRHALGSSQEYPVVVRNATLSALRQVIETCSALRQAEIL